MQLLVLLLTIGGGIYFLVFDPESTIAITLAALTPLGWVGLFMLRFFTERKKRKAEGVLEGRPEKKKFKDPSEYLKEHQ